MAIPRTLAIDVYVVGQQNALDDDFTVMTTYVEASSTPPMPGLVNVVSGNIDLDSITFRSRSDPDYKMSINTTFTLKPSIFDRSGNPVQAIFATPTDKYGLILINSEGKPPKKKNMHAKAITCLQLLLYNKNGQDGEPKADRTYSYALGIFLVRVGQPDYFISLDSTILKSGPVA